MFENYNPNLNLFFWKLIIFLITKKKKKRTGKKRTEKRKKETERKIGLENILSILSEIKKIYENNKWVAKLQNPKVRKYYKIKSGLRSL